MMHFLLNCLQPNAVLMLFVAAVCLLGYGWPARGASTALIWLAIGILAIVSWVLIVAS